MARPVSEPKGPFPQFADAVRRLMAGRSVDDIAQASGGKLSSSTVRRAADGQRIDEDKLDTLSEALGTDPNLLRPHLHYPRLARKDEDTSTVSVPAAQAELLQYIRDPDTEAILRYAAGMPKEQRGVALATIRAMAEAFGGGSGTPARRYNDAAEIAREMEQEDTHGQRADREEHPTE